MVYSLDVTLRVNWLSLVGAVDGIFCTEPLEVVVDVHEGHTSCSMGFVPMAFPPYRRGTCPRRGAVPAKRRNRVHGVFTYCDQWKQTGSA